MPATMQKTGKLARTGLQYSLGLVLIYECCRLLLLPASTHLPVPHVLVKAIAAVELLGGILFLVPAGMLFGGRLLLATFLVAAAVHLMHGEPDIGPLVIYAMAVLTIISEPR
jgi:hypothetical protein